MFSLTQKEYGGHPLPSPNGNDQEISFHFIGCKTHEVEVVLVSIHMDWPGFPIMPAVLWVSNMYLLNRNDPPKPCLYFWLWNWWPATLNSSCSMGVTLQNSLSSETSVVVCLCLEPTSPLDELICKRAHHVSISILSGVWLFSPSHESSWLPQSLYTLSWSLNMTSSA